MQEYICGRRGEQEGEIDKEEGKICDEKGKRESPGKKKLEKLHRGNGIKLNEKARGKHVGREGGEGEKKRVKEEEEGTREDRIGKDKRSGRKIEETTGNYNDGRKRRMKTEEKKGKRNWK